MKASAPRPLASRFEPALKPNQPIQSSDAPIIVIVSAVRRHGLGLATEARADDEAADEARDARVDVDNGAAREVERAELPQIAGIRRRYRTRKSGPGQYQTMCAIGK